MAKNTISQRIALEGGDPIKKLLAEIGKAGEAAFAKLKAAADQSGSGIGTKFTASLAKFKTDLAALQASSARLGAAFNGLRGAFGTFATSLTTVATRLGLVTTAALGAAAAFFKLGQSAINTVDQADRAAQALGLTIEQYSGLSSAAAQSSISSEEFGTALTRLNVLLGKGEDAAGSLGDGLAELDTGFKHLNANQQTANAGTEKTTSALQKLGIATKTAKGELRSTNDVLFDVADAFQKMPDGANKSALAVQLFGRAGARLLPFLNDGSAGIRQLIDDAARMGVVFTEADKRVARLGDQGLDRLALAIQGARTQLGLLFAPLIGAGANTLANFIRDNIELIKDFGRVIIDQGIVLIFDLIQAFKGFDEDVDNKWILTIRDGLVAFGRAVLDIVFGIVLPAWDLLRQGAQLVADTINKYFSTDFTANQVLVAAAVLKLSGALALFGSAFGLVTAAINFFVAAFAPIKLLLIALGSGLAAVGRGIGVIFVGLATILGLPVAVTVAIAAAIAAAAVAIYLYWDEIVAYAEKSWEAIKAGAGPAFDRVKAALAEDIEEIKTLFGGIATSSEQAFARLKEGLRQDINEIKDILAIQVIDPEKFGDFEKGAKAAFARVKKGLGDDIGEIQEILAKEVVSATTWDKFVSGTAEVFDNVQRDLKADVNEIKDILDVQVINPDTFWGDIKTSATNLWNGVEAIITGAATKIGTAVGAVARAAMAAWTGATLSVEASAKAILDAIKKASDIAGNVAGAKTLAAKLVEPFTEAKGQIETVLDVIAVGADAALAGIGTGFQQAIAALPALWQEIVNQIVASAFNAAGAILAPFAAANAAIESGWSAMIASMDSGISAFVSRVETLLAGLQARLASLLAAIASADRGGAPRGSERFAHGGRVHGPGSPTSDTIPAWLSPGEFVIRAAAVDKVGPSFLSLINSGRYSLTELFKRFADLRLPEFSLGGMLDMPVPRFAYGGMVPATAGGPGGGGQPVYLRIGQDTLGPLQGSPDVVGQLMRHAVREQTLSLGRKR